MIDANNHTREEWQSVTLKWLQIYYDLVHGQTQNSVQLLYMLNYGDYSLKPLDQSALYSELSSNAFMDHLDDIPESNACVAFKRVNEWLSNHKQHENNSVIVYYSKTAPIAPSLSYHCQNDEQHQIYQLIHNIFAIKYHQQINLNYVERDIAEFDDEMSVFPNTHSDKDYIAASIAARISQFVCMSFVFISTKNALQIIMCRTEGRGNGYMSAAIMPQPHNDRSDCCAFVSGVEYEDIRSCDTDKIREIERTLSNGQCLHHCDPFEYGDASDRNWNCITNYALLVQYYHICNGSVNETVWNEYSWHCPQCYNVGLDEYDSLCRSGDGREFVFDTFTSENCGCRDITLFLVVIILLLSLLAILIGMVALWYKFNVCLVNQHFKERQSRRLIDAIATEEIGLNDMQSNDDY